MRSAGFRARTVAGLLFAGFLLGGVFTPVATAASGIAVVLGASPTQAHVGDTVTLTATVTNPGDQDLHDVVVSGDTCSPFTYQSGNDGDALLETGESWIYTCAVTIAADGPDPLHSVATATALDVEAKPVMAQGDTTIDILHPGIHVAEHADKTAAHAGDTVTYSFTVTNTGDTPLAVTVSDPTCDPATLTGPAGDNGDSKLATSETWTYGCSRVVKATDKDPLASVVTARGTDAIGGKASDARNVNVSIAKPAVTVTTVASPAHATVGGTETFTVTVHNTGNVALHATSLTDPGCDSGTINGPQGDANGNTQLDTAETWVYGCSHVVGEFDTNPLLNTATFQGFDPLALAISVSGTASVDVQPGPTPTDEPTFEASVEPTVPVTIEPSLSAGPSIGPSPTPAATADAGSAASDGGDMIIPLTLALLALLLAAVGVTFYLGTRGRTPRPADEVDPPDFE